MTQTTTRRDLFRLGTSAAAYAAGAAIVTGGVAFAGEANGASALLPVDRSAWDAAYLALRREQDRDAVIDARHAQARADGTITAELEREWSNSLDPLSDAEWALFETPAPDHAALQWQLTFLRDHRVGLQPNVWERLTADVRRLAGEDR